VKTHGGNRRSKVSINDDCVYTIQEEECRSLLPSYRYESNMNSIWVQCAGGHG